MNPQTLEHVWDDHCSQEFQHRDVDGAMRTISHAPSVNHVPVMRGGAGREDVAAFYSDHFIGETWSAQDCDHDR